MSYARARLWLGISGVGTLVVLSLLALVFRIPAQLLQTGVQPIWRDGYELAIVLFAYAVIQGPFDFFGGHILPTEYGRTQAPFGTFLAGWLRGVMAHSVILLLIGLVLIVAARSGGVVGALGAFIAVALFLMAAQATMAALLGVSYGGHEEKQPGSPPVTLARTPSPYFTGGVVGWPGFERVIIPSRWQEMFPPEQWAAVRLRKAGVVRSGSRARGLLLALAFNTVGFALAYGLGGGTASVSGLVATSLWFTLWQFVGLLILPAPSQRGVFEADTFARANGVSADTLAEIIHRLDQDQDDEPARPSGVEKIFHPLPSVDRRIARLSEPEITGAGTWHAARMSIYLSWAGMSFLSRAVHCNSGRPDAWVFLPSD
jgi:dolichol kinase